MELGGQRQSMVFGEVLKGWTLGAGSANGDDSRPRRRPIRTRENTCGGIGGNRSTRRARRKSHESGAGGPALLRHGHVGRVPPDRAAEDDFSVQHRWQTDLAPPSELGFTRQLLKDGGEENVVPPPDRNDGSEKLRKSEEEGAEGVLLALGPVEAEADVEEVAMVTTAEGRGFPEVARDLRPPLWPAT
ncbi:hypothetical protein EYF80_030310 [Liparis tanakae]|uniref:Uncharacterized protein n=1 Tax=Liparis tanakae TaxID=230148 RepID=A0A4Z2H2G7_9TELE|nr:hypothetical protein EYF80_030310 [Liparis tanakae]